MARLMRFRFAAVVLSAAAVISFSAASASAFTLETVQPAGNGNSTFADPDDHATNSGKGVQPFGSNGPTMQFGVQQGVGTSFGRFQGNGYNEAPPPDPYYGALHNRN
ncbi:MAG: hypothetical protein ABSE22_05860 [Xanthobacteraceae bacterium]